MPAEILVSDDTAKHNPDTEDALGYAPFARRIADVIGRLASPNGYVIAIQGTWGAGKSTALNFARTYIERRNAALKPEETKVEIVEFRPWLISGHEDLVAAFFKVLKEHITPGEAGDRKLGNLLARMSRGAIGPTMGVVTGLAKTLDPTGGLGSAALGDVTSKGVTALLDAWLKEPSLQATYEALRDELAKSNRRFLVVIDDIDRLEPEEIRVVMQLVKSVGSLPNVIYLLSYDRQIVASALGDAERGDGPTFVEKVVQHEIALPRPSAFRLLTLLHQKIEHIIGPTKSTDRWRQIVQLGLERWIARPRDVARLSNALNFSWAALEGEIDAQDLLAMEGLRLFDPILLAFIRDNRAFLLGEGRSLYVSEEQRTQMGKVFRDGLPEKDRDERLELLGTLFPSRAKALQSERVWGGEAWYEQANRVGIGTPAGYDAYFSMLPAEETVPKAWIDEAVAHIGDRERLVAGLDRALGEKSTSGRALIGPYLERFHYRLLGPDAAKPTPALLSALFDRGEAIFAVAQDGDLLGPRAQFRFLVGEMLRQWGRDRGGDLLIEALEQSASPFVCAAQFMERATELKVFPYHGDHPPEATIRRDHLDRLGALTLAQIETHHAAGTLADAPYYGDIAEVWAHLVDVGTPRRWLMTGVLDDPVFLARTAGNLLAFTVAASGPHYFVHRLPKDPWYDVETLIQAASRFVGHPDLTGVDALVVKALADDLPKVWAAMQAKNEEERPNASADGVISED
jgi:hypothetical protein